MNQFATEIQRTPRLVPDYPQGELRLEDPAKPSEKPVFSWMTILIPPLAMMSISIFLSLMIRSHYILISTVGMTMVTVIMSIVTYNSNVKRHLEKNKKLEKKYLDYLFQIRYELKQAANRQRESMLYVHPSVETCMDISR
ncbi:hypothetical protein [Paenibacillus turpanensis]|uniref:hypothetical protein n=1 Tax=Paenibacillus turpanensis TaxID=2689078 RepID=UPI00140CEBDC|nr:hypothetical protein [Paenibacillus turpanensis]